MSYVSSNSDLVRKLLNKQENITTSNKKTSWNIDAKNYKSLNCSYNRTLPPVAQLKGSAKILYLSLQQQKNDLYNWVTQMNDINYFSELENVNLNGCRLNDGILDCFFNCTKLKILSLRNCQLGSISSKVSKLQNLVDLDLSQNKLTTLSLPDDLFSLSVLQVLKLSENKLTDLPLTLINLTKLQKLDISGNEFNEFPQIVLKLSQLTHLYCSHSKISNLSALYMEDSLARLSLQFLDLHSNQIVTFPSKWCQFPELTYFDISCNKIVCLPDSFGDMKKLHHVNLRANQLLLLPPSFSKLPIKDLYVCQNKLATPENTQRENILEYYAGLVPGRYYDQWILDTLSYCFTFRKWSTNELRAVVYSCSNELIRRHAEKVAAEIDTGWFHTI